MKKEIGDKQSEKLRLRHTSHITTRFCQTDSNLVLRTVAWYEKKAAYLVKFITHFGTIFFSNHHTPCHFLKRKRISPHYSYSVISCSSRYILKQIDCVFSVDAIQVFMKTALPELL